MMQGHGERRSSASPVFIRDGLVRWHATRSCGERDAREGAFVYRCSLDAAYRSPLVPCPACAGELAALAEAQWGPITTHDRVRMPIPRLLSLRSAAEVTGSRDDRVLVLDGRRPPR